VNSVEARVVRLLSRTTMGPAAAFTPGAILTSLGIGSLEQIECILALEDEFHVELQEPDLRKLRTVQDVVDAVQRALTSASRPQFPRQ
jgi:acyl carrier protein